jgi:hypothetical protein
VIAVLGGDESPIEVPDRCHAVDTARLVSAVEDPYRPSRVLAVRDRPEEYRGIGRIQLVVATPR